MLSDDMETIAKEIKFSTIHGGKVNNAFSRIKKVSEEWSKTPTNKQSPKLPEIREIVAAFRETRGVYSVPPLTDVIIQFTYDYISGKIGR